MVSTTSSKGFLVNKTLKFYQVNPQDALMSESEIREKIRKLEDLFSKRKISEETYLELKRKLEGKLTKQIAVSKPSQEIPKEKEEVGAAIRAGEGGLTFSEIVYIKAEKFVEKPRFGRNKAPCADKKVKKDKLAASTILAAFAQLSGEGLISFGKRKRKALMGLKEVEETFLYSTGALESVSLEGGIADIIEGSGGEISLQELVSSLVGGRSYDPFEVVLEHIRFGLAQKGLATKKGRVIKKYKVDCNKALPMVTNEMVEEVRGAIKGLEASNPTLRASVLNLLVLLREIPEGPEL